MRFAKYSAPHVLFLLYGLHGQNAPDFATPGMSTPTVPFAPNVWRYREGLKWIGDHIPRADAKSIGEVLARLSPQQIRDAFLAGGYSSPLKQSGSQR
jgi:hypothetical protein